MIKKIGIVWFRQDLRLHDNEALTDAVAQCDAILPVYVFDERLLMEKNEFGFRQISPFRVKFLLESVQALRDSFQDMGGNIIIRVGKPEEEIFKIAHKLRSRRVYCNREREPRNVAIQEKLETHLWSIGQEMHFSRGKMLYHTADLPFPVTQAPDNEHEFRKQTGRLVRIREPLPVPENISFVLNHNLQWGEIPDNKDFGFEVFNPEESFFGFVGGEQKGLEHLNKMLAGFPFASNGFFGSDTSRLNPWLSTGCLSPKLVYHKFSTLAKTDISQKALDSFLYKIKKRDFFRLMLKKYPHQFTATDGFRNIKGLPYKNDFDVLHKWMAGATESSFLNAIMIQLKNTGYLSNQGRRIAADYLVNNKRMNWQLGASYFQSMLIDYDIASNWGNWISIVIDTKHDDRKHPLDISRQALVHDSSKKFTNFWLSKARSKITS